MKPQRERNAAGLVRRSPECVRDEGGFTLIELLTAMAILSILILVLLAVFEQVSRAWRLGERRTEIFQNGRMVLEMMSGDMESAMVGTNDLSSPNAKSLTFLADEDSTIVRGYTGTKLSPTPPNDQLYFVSNASDSALGDYVDLTEYGFEVVYASDDYATMKGGLYYLLRHKVSSTTTNWDFMEKGTVGWPGTWNTCWAGTPQLGPQHHVPILDNVLRFELRFETRGISGVTNAQGTVVCDNWCNSAWGCSGSPSPGDYGITSPETYLPNAVHIQMALIDRRTAARLYAIQAPLTQAQLTDIPDNIDGSTSLSNSMKNVLREGVYTFYRTVYLRNSSK